jgi:hypothetical protein
MKYDTMMAAIPVLLLGVVATNTNQAFAWPYDGGFGYGWDGWGWHHWWHTGGYGSRCLWCHNNGWQGQPQQGQQQGQSQTAKVNVEGNNNYVNVEQGQHQEQGQSSFGSPLDNQCWSGGGWGQCNDGGPGN